MPSTAQNPAAGPESPRVPQNTFRALGPSAPVTGSSSPCGTAPGATHAGGNFHTRDGEGALAILCLAWGALAAVGLIVGVVALVRGWA